MDHCTIDIEQFATIAGKPERMMVASCIVLSIMNDLIFLKKWRQNDLRSDQKITKIK
jgi:hypothetical protein